MTLAASSDGELVRDARAGALAAFEELVRRHEGPLLRYLCLRAGNRHDAEDLAQQAFLRAWRGLGGFDTGRPFGPWLFAIARRLAIDAWRVRRPAVELPEDLAAPAAPAGGGDVWEEARGLLGERQFSSLWLMYGEGRSVAEIARTLGRTAIAVKVDLHRARRRLAAAWAGDPARAAGLARAATAGRVSS